jgi:cell fate regulator YaaT (PSP1 superfamily)
MCCLAYEQSAYEYLGRITPMLNSTVNTPDGPGTVTEVNLVSGQLRVRLDAAGELPQRYYHRDDCEYVRGGKRAPMSPQEAQQAAAVKKPARKSPRPG